VPVPPELLDALDLVHGIREAQGRGQAKAHLWPWSRMTAFRRVQEVIGAAGIPDGPHACPKGLRHGFGVAGRRRDHEIALEVERSSGSRFNKILPFRCGFRRCRPESAFRPSGVPRR
jgi:integrase